MSCSLTCKFRKIVLLKAAGCRQHIRPAAAEAVLVSVGPECEWYRDFYIFFSAHNSVLLSATDSYWAFFFFFFVEFLLKT